MDAQDHHVLTSCASPTSSLTAIWVCVCVLGGGASKCNKPPQDVNHVVYTLLMDRCLDKVTQQLSTEFAAAMKRPTAPSPLLSFSCIEVRAFWLLLFLFYPFQETVLVLLADIDKRSLNRRDAPLGRSRRT